MRLGFTTPTTAPAAAAPGLPLEVRTNLLLAALPLGLALVARGINELDKMIQGRQRRLLRLEGLIRQREHQLGLLGGRPTDADADVEPAAPDACGEPFPCAHRAHNPDVEHPDANPAAVS